MQEEKKRQQPVTRRVRSFSESFKNLFRPPRSRDSSPTNVTRIPYRSSSTSPKRSSEPPRRSTVSAQILGPKILQYASVVIHWSVAPRACHIHLDRQEVVLVIVLPDIALYLGKNRKLLTVYQNTKDLLLILFMAYGVHVQEVHLFRHVTVQMERQVHQTVNGLWILY